MRACRDTFQDFNLRQFWRKIYKKNHGTQQKTNTTAMYINSISFIEATFVNITFQ